MVAAPEHEHCVHKHTHAHTQRLSDECNKVGAGPEHTPDSSPGTWSAGCTVRAPHRLRQLTVVDTRWILFLFGHEDKDTFAALCFIMFTF